MTVFAPGENRSMLNQPFPNGKAGRPACGDVRGNAAPPFPRGKARSRNEQARPRAPWAESLPLRARRAPVSETCCVFQRLSRQDRVARPGDVAARIGGSTRHAAGSWTKARSSTRCKRGRSRARASTLSRRSRCRPRIRSTRSCRSGVHPDAACRVGERRGHAGAGRPARRQRRRVCARRTAAGGVTHVAADGRFGPRGFGPCDPECVNGTHKWNDPARLLEAGPTKWGCLRQQLGTLRVRASALSCGRFLNS